jgi:hypothetical protein
MKKMKTKIYIIAIFSIFSASLAQAQTYYNNLFGLSWEIGLPMTNNNFLSKTSTAGGKVEYRHFINEKFSIGGFFNWRSYYEYFPTDTYENPEKTQAITTDMYRYIYNLPFGVSGHYYFKGGKMVKPFAGLALGTQYSEQTIYYNIFYTEETNWGFLVRPELGAIIKFNDEWGALVGASYAYSSNQAVKFGIRGLADLNFQIGLVFAQ